MVLCVVICLCRRRCAKRRITEALQLQENYNGYNGTSSPPAQSNTSISAHNMQRDTTTPNIKLKSVKMLNVAEDSDDQESPKQIPESPNSTNIPNKGQAQILDLTTDQDQTAENNGNNGNLEATISPNSPQRIQSNSITTGTEHITQQASFVDLDYYAQIATDKELTDGRSRGATTSHQNPMSFSGNSKHGNQILDDEEDDDDIDFDYGSQM